MEIVQKTHQIKTPQELREIVQKSRQIRQNSPNVVKPKSTSTPTQNHNFLTKLALKEKCAVCEKRFKFGKSCLKCQGCGIICHTQCEINVPLICVPLENRTPLEIMTPEKRIKRTRNDFKKQLLFQSPSMI